MGLMNKICFFLLLAIIEAIPSISTTHAIGDVGWETQIRVCGADLIEYMETLCKIKYSEHDNNEHSYNRKESDFQKLATECCENFCTSMAIKSFCPNNSTTPNGMTTAHTIVRPVSTTYSEIPTVLRAIERPHFIWVTLLRRSIPAISDDIIAIGIFYPILARICKWAPLKLLPKRVREIIIRSIGLILKSQSLQEIRKVLLSLFIIINNETDGKDTETGSTTPCEKEKKKLIQAISIGFVDFQEQFDEITNIIESENKECLLLVQEYEKENEGLESFSNPFQTWAENIYKESLTYIREGSGINAMFAPNLVPSILKCMKLLPLWSGLMIPIFGYGETISSSAAVESSFKKLKTVTFKHIDLPINIEEFIENHVIPLRGASFIRSSASSHLSSALQQTHHITEDQNVPIPTTLIHSSPILENINNYENYENFTELPISNNECPLCSAGVFPTEEGAHKCIKCGIPVHALPFCSGQKSDEDNLRICKSCVITKNSYFNDEITAHETWNIKSKREKQKSYITPNPFLRHVNINNSNNAVSLSILKNGSRAEVLKSCNIKDIGKIIFSNTCAFDTLAFIFMVSYCDSERYKNGINGLNFKNPFFIFISNIVANGITSATYTERAKIILNILEPELQPLEYNTLLAICNTTAGLVIEKINMQTPTLVEHITCSGPNCGRPTSRPVVFLTFQTNDGRLNNLQNFLDKRLSIEKSVSGNKSSNTLLCNNTKTIQIIQ